MISRGQEGRELDISRSYMFRPPSTVDDWPPSPPPTRSLSGQLFLYGLLLGNVYKGLFKARLQRWLSACELLACLVDFVSQHSSFL